MTDTLLADSYDAAADYIELHGWHADSLAPGTTGLNIHGIVAKIYSEHPPVCAMGAGYAVGLRHQTLISGSGPFASIEINTWTTRLSQELPNNQFITDWNDDDKRTAEEVIDLLRMTALKIRMGNIGDNPREYEFEPMPTTTPVTEPAAPQPVKDPVPA